MTSKPDYHVLIPAAGCSRRLAHLTTDRPKSLLEIEGKCIIEHSLDVLSACGFRRVTFVVGYKRELLMSTLGAQRGNLSIEYVVSHDYDTTEHGWSLYLTAEAWRRAPGPVIFMDADNLYHPDLLDLTFNAPHENVCMVDENFRAGEREEELVLGENGQISGLQRGIGANFPDLVGGFVGINRFSAEFMHSLYHFMDDFFASHDRQHKYERVFDAFINETNTPLHYCVTNGLAWVNVNHQHDLDGARAIARSMLETPHRN